MLRPLDEVERAHRPWYARNARPWMIAASMAIGICAWSFSWPVPLILVGAFVFLVVALTVDHIVTRRIRVRYPRPTSEPDVGHFGNIEAFFR